MARNVTNSSYMSGSRVVDAGSNDRMQKLAEKLGKISSVIEKDKATKFELYEQKIMNLYNSIEEVKEDNNKKFNDAKEQILIIQKTFDDETLKRETAHNEFMEFMKKMEEKVFEKFDLDFASKKEIELKVAQSLEEKFNIVKTELQRQSKTRFDNIESLELYFEKELPKTQEGFKIEQTDRDENDNNSLVRLNEEVEKINDMIVSEKKSREETQEGILEMIKIMNERMKTDLSNERKEREQNEEILIELLDNTCTRLQETSGRI